MLKLSILWAQWDKTVHIPQAASLKLSGAETQGMQSKTTISDSNQYINSQCLCTYTSGFRKGFVIPQWNMLLVNQAKE